MDDFEFGAPDHATDYTRDVVLILRAWFDACIDGLEPAALRFLREQVAVAERTPANVEILAAIDRRLAHFLTAPPARN